MATAATWLTELGTPPHEICLDWSWQLRVHSRQVSIDASRQSTQPLAWENIEVTETGVLQVDADYHLHSVDLLLQQLENWGSATNSVSILADHSATSSHATVIELAESQSLQPAKPLRPAKQNRAAASPVASMLSYVKRHPTIAIAGCLLAAAGAGWFLLAAGKSQPHPHEPTVTQSQKEQVAATEPNTPSSATESVSAEDLSVADFTPLPTLADVLGVSNETDNSPSIKPSTVDLAGKFQLSPSSPVEIGSVASSELPASEVASSEVAAGEVIEEPSKSSTSLSQSEGDITAAEAGGEAGAKDDVMRDIETLSKSAEMQEVKSEFSVKQLDKPELQLSEQQPSKVERSKGETSEAVSMLEPLVLKTSPLVQTHLLPTTLARPRESVWSIAVMADSEFTIEPQEAQRLSGRQTAMWILSDAKAKAPATRLVIQAQLAPGRQAGLRWRIAASAEDLPALALPVAPDALRSIQQHVLRFSEVARNESKRLSALSQNAEKDLRTVLTKQRTALDSQAKIASRLATVVAEAQLLDDFLRSQVTLYVELFDGEKANTPLLKFGNLSQVRAESEAAQDADRSVPR